MPWAPAELDSARFALLQRDRDGVLEQNPGIPGMAAEGADAALAVGGLVLGDVFHG